MQEILFLTRSWIDAEFYVWIKKEGDGKSPGSYKLSYKLTVDTHTQYPSLGSIMSFWVVVNMKMRYRNGLNQWLD